MSRRADFHVDATTVSEQSGVGGVWDWFQWRCKINFEEDVMEINQQVLDDMTGPVTIRLQTTPRPDE